jgi:hypothetical protein
MAVATKFQVAYSDESYSTRVLCEDCLKEAVYSTYLTETPSVASPVTLAELKAMPFPSCDVCEASFAGALQAVAS